MPEIVIIAAVAEGNRVIGDGLKLPWHIPKDLKHFKDLTYGHPLVMGRRTFESLMDQFGGPLSGRDNLVLTSEPDKLRKRVPDAEHVRPFEALEEALAWARDREIVFIGGGARVYETVLDESGGGPLADRLELTLVEGSFEGDTFFPPYEHLMGRVYEQVYRDPYPAENGRPAFRFETWVKRRK